MGSYLPGAPVNSFPFSLEGDSLFYRNPSVSGVPAGTSTSICLFPLWPPCINLFSNAD